MNNPIKPLIKMSWLLIACAGLLLHSFAAVAQNRVVVVPLIGNGPDLRPIRPENLIERRGIFTTFSSRAIIGTVTDDRAFVITSITVSPERYLSTYRPITLRFCREPSSCSHSYNVPNNTISKIDFGIGDLFTSNGRHYIDIVDRGGLPENVANQIIIHVSGYFYDR